MKSLRFLLFGATIVSFISAGVIWLGIFRAEFGQSQLAFNQFSLLSLASVLINTLLIVLLWRRARSSETGFWFLIFLISITFWALAEFFQRISTTPDQAFTWQMIAVFGWATMPFVYLLFVLSYTNNQDHIRKIAIQIGGASMVAGMVFAHLKTGITVSSQVSLEPWGYDSAGGTYLNVFTVWLFAMFISAIGLLIHEYHSKDVSKQKRKQIKLLIAGALIPLIGGSCTDLILPGIFGMRVMPIATFLIAVQGVIIAYGVFRSQLFTINPASLSGEIMKTLPQPVIGTDNKFQIQFMNASAKQLFGRHRKFANEGMADIIGPDNFKKIELALDKNTDEEIVKIDRLPLKINQSTLVLQAQVSKIDKSDAGYVFSMADVTDQALALQTIAKEVRLRTELYHQERARLLASVSGLRQGFLITDDKKQVVLINEQAQKMLSQTKKDDIDKPNAGAHLSKIFTDVDVDIDKIATKVMRTNKYQEIYDVSFDKLVLDIDVLPISKDGDVIGIAVLFDDITERVLAQRSKDEFFSIASHELRTPLTAIRGNTSMMLDYYGKKLDKDTKEMVQDMYDSSLRLIEIVNDFLDTSRLEQGRMEFNPQDIEMSAIIKKVVSQTQALASDRGNIIKIDAQIDDLPFVHADASKLEQVIYNLVGNAIKFTSNGRVVVQGAQIDNQVKIRVSDSGRGIGKEGKKLLFRKFQQTGGSLLTRDTTKGTGLGLYISKLILEQMGGSIGLEHSEPDVGSAFYFTVPVAKINRDDKDR